MRRLLRRGGRPKGQFRGTDNGEWEYGEIDLGALKAWDWEATVGLASKNGWRTLHVEGATEQNAGVLKALRDITKKYPEVADFVIQFDGPWMPVSEVVRATGSQSFRSLTFYHGTSSVAAEAILRHGLSPRASTGSKAAYGASLKPSAHPDAVYLTTQANMAKFAARDAARATKSEAVILEIKGFDGDPENWIPDEDSGVKDSMQSVQRLGSVAYRGTIPARHIRVISRLKQTGLGMSGPAGQWVNENLWEQALGKTLLYGAKTTAGSGGQSTMRFMKAVLEVVAQGADADVQVVVETMRDKSQAAMAADYGSAVEIPKDRIVSSEEFAQGMIEKGDRLGLATKGDLHGPVIDLEVMFDWGAGFPATMDFPASSGVHGRVIGDVIASQSILVHQMTDGGSDRQRRLILIKPGTRAIFGLTKVAGSEARPKGKILSRGILFRRRAVTEATRFKKKTGQDSERWSAIVQYPIPDPPPPRGKKSVLMGSTGPIAFPVRDWKKGVAWATKLISEFSEPDKAEIDAERRLRTSKTWSEFSWSIRSLHFGPAQFRGAEKALGISREKLKRSTPSERTFWDAVNAVAAGLIGLWTEGDDLMAYIQAKRWEYMDRWDTSD
jgi:hypothetical protein